MPQLYSTELKTELSTRSKLIKESYRLKVTTATIERIFEPIYNRCLEDHPKERDAFETATRVLNLLFSRHGDDIAMKTPSELRVLIEDNIGEYKPNERVVGYEPIRVTGESGKRELPDEVVTTSRAR